MYKLQFDGASKGNPGICGAGFVIYRDNTTIERGYAMMSLKNTNNFAEYSALLLGIKKVIELEIKDIIVEGDSELIIKQLNKVYDVKSPNLLPIYDKIIEELMFFDSFKFKHIKRGKNVLADKLANHAIKEYYKNKE